MKENWDFESYFFWLGYSNDGLYVCFYSVEIEYMKCVKIS